MGFQTQVNVQPAPAAEGDFASANPRFTLLAGPGGMFSGPAGVTVGRFAWSVLYPVDPNSAPMQINSSGAGPVAGFIGRHQQALITAFLAESGMLIPTGFPLFVYTGGDFWVKNNGTTQALVGQKAYANFANGGASFAATGAPTNVGTSTASAVVASTFSVTGSISGSVLTVTAVSSGFIPPGATISGTGIATGTQIVGQLTGTNGGIGTYTVSIPEQTVASTTVSGTYGTLTVGGTVTGTFNVGDTITGGAAGTQISSNNALNPTFTGTGGAGTYAVNNNTAVGSTAINAQANVETKWFAMSAGLAGELVKISDHPTG
jgi:hypothetical protein